MKLGFAATGVLEAGARFTVGALEQLVAGDTPVAI
jgi:hypothetical protein